MRKRILIMTGMLVLLNVYAVSHIAELWPWAGQHPGAMWLAGAAFIVLQLTGPFGDRLLFPKLRGRYGLFLAIVDWASYLAFGVMSLLVVYGLVTDIVSIVWILTDPPSNTAVLDRDLLLIFVGLTLGTVALGIGQAQAGPRVQEVTIPLRNLPPEFDGFKIAQVSDLHVGPTIGRAYVENVVDIVNGLKPDLIALTGDFADGAVKDFGADTAPLADLKAPHGMFFVTGNHEYFWDLKGWIAHYKKLGADVLLNEHRLVRRGENAILLAGVTDYSTRAMGFEPVSDPRKALEGAPQGLVKILLAHQPASYKKAYEAGFDLQLSGHTHGGQYFPFNLLIRFFQRYYKGLNRHGKMWVYVNRGTGYWGPPLRAGVPAEITHITLKSE